VSELLSWIYVCAIRPLLKWCYASALNLRVAGHITPSIVLEVTILRQIMDQADVIQTSFPVAVILEKYLIERAFWSLPEWRLFGVAASAQ